jgi:SAM-dependent MidA family methyltransferase
MIESSSYQRSLQEIQLASHESKITWMDPKEWNQRQHSHIQFVIANELLDAFAVHRVRLSSSGYLECYVGWNEEVGEFTEVWLELTDADVWAYLAAEQLSLQVGQIIEVNLQAHEWIREVSETMTMGQLIVIDYGDITEQLWTSSRRRGTLLCYRNHVAHDQFYSFCGEQDITAHVNFSACLRTAQASGFTDLSYKTQRQFLVEQGILDRLQNHEDPNPFSEVAKKNRSIRQLLISDQMSELFKVLVMKKDSVQKTESK